MTPVDMNISCYDTGITPLSATNGRSITVGVVAVMVAALVVKANAGAFDTVVCIYTCKMLYSGQILAGTYFRLACSELNYQLIFNLNHNVY